MKFRCKQLGSHENRGAYEKFVGAFVSIRKIGLLFLCWDTCKRREFFYLAGTIAQQHLPQVLGSDAQRLIFSLEQDAARCDRLVQRERIDAGELRHRHEHFARDKPNAEVAAHSRKDLIDGLYLHVRTERQVVPQKEVGIEIVGRCSLGETDDGIRRASA